jgi:PEP-CTERM motif
MLKSIKTSRKFAAIGYAALGALALALPAQANLVTNGSFELSSAGPGQMDTNTTVTGWSTTGSGTNGYNFLFDPATVSTTGSPGEFGNVALWGPISASPDGGNFIGADGGVQVFPVSQTINGLIAGNTYTLGFWWGAAQQSGFDGDNAEQWQVSFGGQTQSTAVLANPSHGFTGWQRQTFDFIAASSSEVLAFLAIGTPSGVPPFALLDGVTLDPAGTSVPEPGMLALLGIGLFGVPAVRKLRNKR